MIFLLLLIGLPFLSFPAAAADTGPCGDRYGQQQLPKLILGEMKAGS